MTTKHQLLPTAAVYIDAENLADLDVSALMQQLGQFDVVERHAYADRRNQCLDGLFASLEREEFVTHHIWSGHRLGTYKNASDRRMEKDIRWMQANHPEIEVFVIISGDRFFAKVARQLKRKGRRVVVAAGPLRMSKELHKAANSYLPIGELQHWIVGLDQLEYKYEYVTFRFAVQKLEIEPAYLAGMIRKGLVIQQKVLIPHRGVRKEIRLNRHADAVLTVLGTVRRASGFARVAM